MRGVIEEFRIMDVYTSTDWYGMEYPPRVEHTAWQSSGISPVLRFMRYERGGEHNTHYDMGYDYEARNLEDRRRTLMSFVLYLTTCEEGTGGRTRFIRDRQDRLPVRFRNHDDWTRRAFESEVRESVRPECGKVLFFDHRLPHDVETYTGDTPRIIIRGDVVYKAIY